MRTVTHAQLVDLTNYLYPKKDFFGLCYGLTCMFLGAYRLNGIARFTQRLEFIGELLIIIESAGVTRAEFSDGLKYRYDDKKSISFRRKLDKIPTFWSAINYYLNPSQTSTNLIQSVEAKKETWDHVRIDILAFLDGVSLNFNTSNHPEIFPTGALLGQNAELSRAITWPVQNPPRRRALFSGIYSNAELIIYFEALNTLIPQRNELTDFILNGHNHTIGLVYDSAQQKWLLFDSNKLPFIVIEDKAHFAREIMSSFEEGEYACFSTDCYQTASIENLTEENFNSNPKWSKLHEVTSNRAILKTQSGASWLHIAAKNGHVAVVPELLAAGADRNQATAEGVTPLYIAAQNGHVEVVRELLDQGSDRNQATAEGTTPLYIAAESGHVAVVQMLLNKGADPNQANLEGTTPLYIAAQNGHVEVVRMLLDKGADRNQATTEGVTPLCIAAYYGHIEIVRELLVAGADPNQANAEGATPLCIAAYYGHVEIVRELLVAGADPYQALDIAARKGDVVKVRNNLLPVLMEMSPNIVRSFLQKDEPKQIRPDDKNALEHSLLSRATRYIMRYGVPALVVGLGLFLSKKSHDEGEVTPDNDTLFEY